MSSKFEDRKKDLIEELEALNDPQDRFQFLVERAKEEPPLSDEYKLDSFKVKGCMSSLWIAPKFNEDKTVSFLCDCDAMIPKGIALTILDLFQDETPKNIIDSDLSFLSELGLKEQLSPNRRNALSQIENYIKHYAKSL